MKRFATALLTALVLAPAQSAAGDGPPVTSLDAGPDGVVEHDGGDRLVALPAATETIVARTRVDGGQVRRATALQGRWGVPIVAEDGTTGGISADARTLVLFKIARAYPRRRSSFRVLDLRSFSVGRTISLRGDWSFDALSPDGRWLYLVQQLSARDRTRYAVRAYDIERGRLMPDPVVDPREPDEPMQGLPITRVTGPSGRWEYTLYAGGRGHPFVHALDTVGRTSICIDLPHRVARHRRLFDLELELRGGRVRVVDGGRVVASASRRTPEKVEAASGPWLLVAAGATGALLGGAALLRRRQA
jgi:hypothetical protein